MRVKAVKPVKVRKLTLAQPKAITMPIKTRIPRYGRKR